MENQIIPEVEFHKHLCIFFSNDLTWHKHIDYVSTKAWERINVMRKLKFTLDRSSLEKIYLTFIRPLLEYGDILFDNCTQNEKSSIEKIQHEAARIVTGATKLVSIEKLNKEVGWESLETRRRNHKLTLFYKMINNQTPAYLSDLIPLTVGDNSRYPLRNSNNIQTINARTNHYHNSFLPSVIREWNNTPASSRNAVSTNAFKHSLKNPAIASVQKHYYHGLRKLQILHTRLRTNCSSLNNDLHSKNMTDSPLCTCGLPETTSHFLLSCDIYAIQRATMINAVKAVKNCTRVPLSLLLFGDNSLSYPDNIKIVDAVHTFIRNTNHFN